MRSLIDMGNESGIREQASLSDYLAAERTLLAWIRTGLALMGFGFVVARFGLFLQQLQVVEHAQPTQSDGVSLWFGTALIAAGVAVNLLAASHYARLMRQLDIGQTTYAHPKVQSIVIALFLALMGIAMAIYLVSVRSSTHPKARPEKETSMTTSAIGNGIVTVSSKHSVEETVAKLQGILQAKSITLFALIDHSGEAQKVGIEMHPTKLLIFGNPKGGTPVMLAAPSSAIDLPLKALVWEDDHGKVWISYNAPAYLQQRHGVPQDLLQNISGVEALAAKAAE